MLTETVEVEPYELAPDTRRLVMASGASLVFYCVRADIDVLHIRCSERRPAVAHELAQWGEN